MISKETCTECCRKQIIKLAEILNTSHSDIMDSFNKKLKEKVYNYAPEYAQFIFEKFREKTNIIDPYKEIKEKSNSEARILIPKIKETLSKKPELEALVELSIIGNMIDYGAFDKVDIKTYINNALNAPFFKFDIREFEMDIKKAKKILYIVDNAGEIIFDLSLLNFLKNKEVTIATRKIPIINDVTYEDAIKLNIENVNIIHNGNGIPGTLLDKTTDVFLNEFYGSDLVISKGQGNFETLFMQYKDLEQKPNLYYLFVVKCLPVAKLINANVNDKVLMRAN